MTMTFKASIAAVLATGLLAGCSTSDNEPADAPVPQDQAVVVSTVAADFSSGAHAVFDADAPFAGNDQYAPTGSDVVVAAHAQSFYRIERFNADHITKFAVSAPGTPVWQYSVLDAGETTANPQGMVFASESKAYVPRLGSPNVWIVDPSAASSAAFKTGSLDLSAYDDGTGSPDPAGGVVVNGKLFIIMQRLDAGFAPGDAYVAVFDTGTDAEIDTGKGGALKGIPLSIKNPTSIQYSADTGMIYVSGVGRYFPQEFTGGIEAIDPADYSTDLILDDGDATTHPIGQISGFALVSATKGYVIGYAGWKNTGLYEFNLVTGALVTDTSGDPVAIDGLSGADLRSIAVDSKDKLWVSIASDSEPGLRVIDTSDNSVVEQRVATVLNPTRIVFADAE